LLQKTDRGCGLGARHHGSCGNGSGERTMSNKDNVLSRPLGLRVAEGLTSQEPKVAEASTNKLITCHDRNLIAELENA
jgi:hypothetical protein